MANILKVVDNQSAYERSLRERQKQGGRRPPRVADINREESRLIRQRSYLMAEYVRTRGELTKEMLGRINDRLSEIATLKRKEKQPKIVPVKKVA